MAVFLRCMRIARDSWFAVERRAECFLHPGAEQAVADAGSAQRSRRCDRTGGSLAHAFVITTCVRGGQHDLQAAPSESKGFAPCTWPFSSERQDHGKVALGTSIVTPTPACAQRTSVTFSWLASTPVSLATAATQASRA